MVILSVNTFSVCSCYATFWALISVLLSHFNVLSVPSFGTYGLEYIINKQLPYPETVFFSQTGLVRFPEIGWKCTWSVRIFEMHRSMKVTSLLPDIMNDSTWQKAKMSEIRIIWQAMKNAWIMHIIELNGSHKSFRIKKQTKWKCTFYKTWTINL